MVLRTEQKVKIPLLMLAVIAYLYLPYILFVLYLGNVLALSLAAVILAIIISQRRKINIAAKVSLTRKRILLIIFALLVYILLGGFPQLTGYEVMFDWEKHNTVLNDLISRNWPVIYADGSSLNYYLGFYFVPALFGKLLSSFAIGKLALCTWGFAGFLLAAFLLNNYVAKYIASQGKRVLAMLMVLLFSGLDWLHYTYTFGNFPPFRRHIEWSYQVLHEGAYLSFFQYASVVTSILFVPQHFYPAVLGVLLVLLRPGIAMFCLPAIAVWSPLSAAGVLLVLLISQPRLFNLRSILLTSMLTVPVVFFFSHHAAVDTNFLFSSDLKQYLIFIVAELTGVTLLFAAGIKYLPANKKRAGLIVLILLAVFPLLRLGADTANDVLIRTAMPLLIFLLLLGISTVGKINTRWLLFILLIWLLGLVTPFYAIAKIQPGKGVFPPAESIQQISGGDHIRRQYLGKPWN